MTVLKRLSSQAIASALEKAERYRLLNEPAEAESICLDVLAVEPGNQRAVVTLLLAISDGFAKGCMASDTDVHAILQQLESEYERAYYSGIIFERKAKARLEQAFPESGYMAFDLLQQAMQCYERAETLRPAGNDDALLRWNTCVRIIDRNKLSPKAPDAGEPYLE